MRFPYDFLNFVHPLKLLALPLIISNTLISLPLFESSSVWIFITLSMLNDLLACLSESICIHVGAFNHIISLT